MSDLSNKLMSEKHKGLHEQFDVVYAAILAYMSLNLNEDSLATSLRSHHKKIIKTEIKQSMKKIKFKSGFLSVGLSFYAYEFWEIIVSDTLGPNITSEKVSELSNKTLAQMAEYLEEQFRAKGIADSIGFLKIFL